MNRTRISRWALAILVWAVWIVPVVAAPPSQGEQTTHIVQPGETLYVIAQQYGVTVDEIVALNSLTNPDQLQVGQQLIIPQSTAASATTVYVVQPGDTLHIIAHRYGMSTEALAQANHLTNPNLIYVGQELLVPTTAKPASEKPAGSQVYVVQVGDTMAQIASHFNTTVWAIAQANEIANPNVLQVGQRLLIPTGDEQSSLPLPFLAVHIIPPVVVQGQTVQVVVETDGEVTLGGTYNEAPLFFVSEAGTYRTLIGIYALATPGPYPLDLKAFYGDRQVSVRSMVQVVEGNFGTQYLTFSDDKADLLDPTLVAQEAQRVWDLTTQATLPGRWEGIFDLPLVGNPPISAPFGTRRSYQSGPPTSFHGGVDYGVPEGTAVYCPARGRVVLAEALQVRGNAIIVDHGRGVMSGYWHLAQIDVAVGQEVEKGDLLGLVGNTGLSTGAHLHWEIRVMGIHVDPLQWTREVIQ